MASRTISPSAYDLATRIRQAKDLCERLFEIAQRFRNSPDTRQKLKIIAMGDAAWRRRNALETRIRDTDPRSIDDVVAQLIGLMDDINQIWEPPIAGNPENFREVVERRLHKMIHFLAAEQDIDVLKIGGDMHLLSHFSPEIL